MKRALPVICCLSLLLLSFANFRPEPRRNAIAAPVAAALNGDDLQRVFSRLDQIENMVEEYKDLVEKALTDATPPKAVSEPVKTETTEIKTHLDGISVIEAVERKFTEPQPETAEQSAPVQYYQTGAACGAGQCSTSGRRRWFPRLRR